MTRGSWATTLATLASLTTWPLASGAFQSAQSMQRQVRKLSEQARKDMMRITAAQIMDDDEDRAGRNLASADMPCMWVHSQCTTNPAWMRAQYSALPGDSHTKRFGSSMDACSNLNTTAECHGSADCMWNKDKNSCDVADHRALGLIASFVPFTGCGVYGNYLQPPACMESANGADCGKVTGCMHKVAPSNGVCNVDVCEPHDDYGFQVSCDNFTMDVGNLLDGCGKSSSSNAGVDTAAFTQCLTNACPQLEAVWSVFATCVAQQTTASCDADSNCMWNSGENSCNPQMTPILTNNDMESTCRWKDYFTRGGACDSKQEAACKAEADCEWESETTCRDDNGVLKPETERSCDSGDSLLEAFMAENCNGDDNKAYVMMSTADSQCEGKTTRATCEAHTVAEPDCSSDANASHAPHHVSYPHTLLALLASVAVLYGCLLQ